jgi:hypothetical protein
MRVLVALFVLLCSCKERGPTAIPSPGTYRTESLTLRIGDAVEQIPSASVTNTFFSEAQIEPLVGRLFTPDDYARPGVAVISARLWKRRFGGDPAVIGRTIQLNGQDCTIVGILPETFGFPPDVEIWIPM